MIFKETATYTKLKNKPIGNYPKYLIIHHTGGTDLNPLADTSHHTAKMVEDYHISKGWEGIGYHYFIEKDGTIWRGRPEHYHGAHTTEQNKNKESLGLCMAGNFDLTLPTDAQIKSLTELLNETMKRYAIPKEKIEPHRKFAVKSCYGKLLSNDWARNLISQPVENWESRAKVAEKKLLDIKKILES